MGRASYGVTGIKMAKDDEVVSLEVLPLGKEADKFAVLTITKKGYGKRSEIKDYRLTGRAGLAQVQAMTASKITNFNRKFYVLRSGHPPLPTPIGANSLQLQQKALQHNTRASDTGLIIFAGTDVRPLVPSIPSLRAVS